MCEFTHILQGYFTGIDAIVSWFRAINAALNKIDKLDPTTMIFFNTYSLMFVE